MWWRSRGRVEGLGVVSQGGRGSRGGGFKGVGALAIADDIIFVRDIFKNIYFPCASCRLPLVSQWRLLDPVDNYLYSWHWTETPVHSSGSMWQVLCQGWHVKLPAMLSASVSFLSNYI